MKTISLLLLRALAAVLMFTVRLPSAHASAAAPTLVHSFNGYSEGANPRVPLVLAADGTFYGATGGGGSAPAALGKGTIFKITTSGGVTTLASFPAAGTSGSGPNSLVLASDGNLYGTTGDGGSSSGGAFIKVAISGAHPAFFSGEISLGSSIYYLAFSTGNYFGYYAYLSDAHYLYHFDLGYEYWFDAADGKSGIYFYDFASSTYFYTSPTFPFPYLYDFSLNTVLYYYPNTGSTGHYTTSPRYFYNFATGKVITK